MRRQRTALKRLRIGSIGPLVKLRSFFAILIAAAMLLAPFVMPTGSAMAAAPANHHGEAMPAEHCGEEADEMAPDEGSSSSCCTAMCSAVAAAPAGISEPALFAPSIERPGAEQFEPGIVAELPTPPPRLS